MVVDELKISIATRQWLLNGGYEKIKKYIKDPDGIFTTEAGKKAGVYMVKVLTPEGAELLMYIGEVGQAHCFADRFVEHARLWIENPETYTGLKKEDLNSDYKYLIQIVQEEPEYQKRYLLEQHLCEMWKPYLQSGYPKYEGDYRGSDLSIHFKHRRKAFLKARDGKSAGEKVIAEFFGFVISIDSLCPEIKYLKVNYQDEHIFEFSLEREVFPEIADGRYLEPVFMGWYHEHKKQIRKMIEEDTYYLLPDWEDDI